MLYWLAEFTSHGGLRAYHLAIPCIFPCYQGIRQLRLVRRRLAAPPSSPPDNTLLILASELPRHSSGFADNLHRQCGQETRYSGQTGGEMPVRLSWPFSVPSPQTKLDGEGGQIGSRADVQITGNSKASRWSAQSAGSGLRRMSLRTVSSIGCRPSRIATTMSVLRKASGRMRLTSPSSTPTWRARLAIVW